MMAAEMAIIRITHISDSPTPEELIKKLTNTQTEGTATQKLNPTNTVNSSGQSIYKSFQKSEINSSENNGNTALAIDTETLAIQYPTFESVLEIIRKFRDMKLLIDVENSIRLNSYLPGRIEFTPTEDAPKDLAQRLGLSLIHI